MADLSESEKKRCEAVVLHRDTYRVARGTKSGFRMHYNKKRCTRAAKCDGLCGVHAKVANMRYVERRPDW